jgi:hypothetical protein
MAPEPGQKERVEIQWIIKTASGDERGRVVQLNEIPAGTLDHYWGDVAEVVASEASNGVNDVIKRQSDREPTPGEPAPAAVQEPPPVVTMPGPKPEPPAARHPVARHHAAPRHGAAAKAKPVKTRKKNPG